MMAITKLRPLTAEELEREFVLMERDPNFG